MLPTRHELISARRRLMGDSVRLASLTPDSPRDARPTGPVRFSLSDAPARERPAIYRDFFARSVMGVEVEPMDEGSFNAEVTLQAMQGLHVFSGRVHGSYNRRTRAMLADGRDQFTLMVNLGGPYLVSQRDEEIVLGDGDATLVSVGDPCSFAHRPPGDVLALRFPRQPLGALVSGIEDHCLRRIPRNTPALMLLNDYVGISRDEQTIASPALQHLFVSHVHDLIAVALGATRDAEEAALGRGLRAARMRAIKNDIADHLGRPDLSAATVAGRHGCTLRCVQRLFETEGTTFTDYVLAQRLIRAHRRLTDPRRDGEKISAVAYDCGFGDVSYFNRVFRRHYGATPSDIKLRARRGAPTSPI
jgi:AraC-like DNA-binding protein